MTVSRTRAHTTDTTPSAVVVIGHRGCGITRVGGSGPTGEAATDQPKQNTRVSFLAAHARGADWVELDLIPSADGDLMVHHDPRLIAYGDDRGIWETPTSDLLAYGIETLDGLCEALPPELGLYLDLKASPGDVDPEYGHSTVVLAGRWVRQHRAHRRLLTASFNPFAIADLSDAGLPAGWIVAPTLDLFTAVVSAARARVPVVIVHGTAFTASPPELERAMEIAVENAVEVWVWGPSLSDVSSLRALGVTGFCVDDITATRTLLH